jgi:hypothetical protein
MRLELASVCPQPLKGRRTQDCHVLFTVGETSDMSTPNNMAHLDGKALISNGAMKKLVKSLPFAPQNSANASIVQVRIGGAKGTLTS